MAIDEKIVKLLEKIGCLWPPMFLDCQLKTIAPIWHKKLFIFDADILDQTLDELVDNFRRKPSLAEFLAVCKKNQKRKEPLSVSVVKDDFIDYHKYRSEIAQRFGDEAAKKLDASLLEWQKAKKEGKTKEYTESIIQRMRMTIKSTLKRH